MRPTLRLIARPIANLWRLLRDWVDSRPIPEKSSDRLPWGRKNPPR